MMQQGKNITATQTHTHAKIQLTKAGEYFPGTRERVLLVSGRLTEIVMALYLIFIRLIKEDAAPVMSLQTPEIKDSIVASDEEDEFTDHNLKQGLDLKFCQGVQLLVKMLVPEDLCGIIVGKGGLSIKHCSESTQTLVKVASSRIASSFTTHKIVSIQGNLKGIMKAVASLILKQAEDPHFGAYGSLPSSFLKEVDRRHIQPYFSPHGLQSHYRSMGLPHMGAGYSEYGALPGMTSAVFPISMRQKDILMFDDGSFLREVEAYSGVAIRVEFSAPKSICLRVTGPVEGVGYAHSLILHKLTEFG